MKKQINTIALNMAVRQHRIGTMEDGESHCFHLEKDYRTEEIQEKHIHSSLI